MHDERIDELRGFACLLVVLFHAIGSEPALAQTGWTYVTDSLSYIRLPLFIAITGYLYGRRRAERPMTTAAWVRRIERLLPPFLVATALCTAIERAKGYTPSILLNLSHGMWHLWYILALIVILTIVLALDQLLRPRRSQLWLLAAGAAALAATHVTDGIRLLSTDGAFRLLPHFLFGAAVGASHGRKTMRQLRPALYAAGVVALIVVQAGVIGIGPRWATSSLPGIALGWAAFVAIGTHIPASRPLARLGEASFPIFLWHLPCAALLSAIWLNPLHIAPEAGVALRVAFGLSAPILGLMVVERIQPGLVPLFGRRTRRAAPADRPLRPA